ncbi:hypothetical protein HK104_009538 [Borealophlyctis nickersoniae]|nr:hypothetical protein HK104_009538 [Borealophlyctis nickersoniae]
MFLQRRTISSDVSTALVLIAFITLLILINRFVPPPIIIDLQEKWNHMEVMDAKPVKITYAGMPSQPQPSKKETSFHLKYDLNKIVERIGRSDFCIRAIRLLLKADRASERRKDAPGFIYVFRRDNQPSEMTREWKIGCTRIGAMKRAQQWSKKYSASEMIFYPLKDTCSAFLVKYSRIRSLIHRGKIRFNKIVLTGDTLHAFKLEAHYETSASHLQFIDGEGLQRILHRCGVETVRLVAEEDVTALATEEVADSEPEHEQYYHASSRMQVQSFRPAGAFVDSNQTESDPTVDDPMTLDETSSVLEITNHDHDRDTSNEEIVESDPGSAEPEGLEKCCLRPMPDVDDADLSKGIKSVINFKW